MGRRRLSVEEENRLERKAKSLRNRRNRKNPAVMPDRLARTSAFVPRKKNLSTDQITRIYEIPGISLIEVRGRELGSQHRDALYALFRLERTTTTIRNGDYAPGRLLSPTISTCRTVTTWRELLRTMRRSQHVNNLLTMLETFKAIQMVNLTVYDARTAEEMETVKRNLARGLIGGPGSAAPLITEVKWEGAQLDSRVEVVYGPHMIEMIEKTHLVSINAEVHFRLKSDYAKSLWAFIDSMPTHTWIGEDRIMQLTGRDPDEVTSTSQKMGQFRKECRQAMADMVAAGGLSSWETKITGSGSSKRRFYHYVHSQPRHCELVERAAALDATATDGEATTLPGLFGDLSGFGMGATKMPTEQAPSREVAVAGAA